MNLKRLYALFAARNMEFFRDRTALGWNFIMPVMIVIGFSVIFNVEERALFKVGVLGVAGVPVSEFQQLQHVQFLEMEDAAEAITKVERHQLDMLIEPAAARYWINAESPNGYFLEKLLPNSAVAAGANGWVKQAVSGAQVRYIDWVIPGVLAMNMLFSALYGVGYVIVRYRKNGVLKRLRATPLGVVEFLVAQLLSRLWIILTVGAIVFGVLNLLFGFRMYGSYLLLLLLYSLGGFSLIALGLIVASRLASEETADGILNLLSWPMMFLSGIWFSLDGAHPLVQKLAQVFPLTHVTSGARAVMLDGAGLQEVLPQLLSLAGMGVLFLIIGAWLFRWES